MNKKLTLNIDESLIDFAHLYSKKTNQSISSIIEKYLTALKKENDALNLSSVAGELYGFFMNDPVPDTNEMSMFLHEKNSH